MPGIIFTRGMDKANFVVKAKAVLIVTPEGISHRRKRFYCNAACYQCPQPVIQWRLLVFRQSSSRLYRQRTLIYQVTDKFVVLEFVRRFKQGIDHAVQHRQDEIDQYNGNCPPHGRIALGHAVNAFIGRESPLALDRPSCCWAVCLVTCAMLHTHVISARRFHRYLVSGLQLICVPGTLSQPRNGDQQ